MLDFERYALLVGLDTIRARQAGFGGPASDHQ
jgi:hypothetical protein